MDNRPTKQSVPRWIFRYVTGRPLDGFRRTDSNFLHPGTKVLNGSGRPSAWERLPGWKRAAWRVGIPAGGVLWVVGYVQLREIAGWLAALFWILTVAGCGTYVTLETVQQVRGYRHRRTVVRPLAATLAPVLGADAGELERGIKTPGAGGKDRSSVLVPLPDHYAGRADQVKDLVRVVGQRVGGEWDADLNLKRHPFYCLLTPTPAPPGSLRLADVLPAIEATTQDKPILGLGTRSEVIRLDFTGEIAHLAASIGTGGGKSSFLRYLIAQFAYHGVSRTTVIDTKMVSLQGMEDVPGVRIHVEIEDCWSVIEQERAEMDRRYQELRLNPKATFPRRVLVLEEQNAFAKETQIRWDMIRPKGSGKTAPVWANIGLLLLKARQVNMNLVGVYQRMDADACGGGTYRDQYGLKLLSRFGPQAWDMLVGTRPRGVSSVIQGRALAVMGGSIRTVQLPFVTIDEAVKLGNAGVTVTCDADNEVSATPACDVTPSEPRYTLAEAARQTWCTVSHEALRQRASRGRAAGTWPVGILRDGVECWTQDELEAAITRPTPIGARKTA